MQKIEINGNPVITIRWSICLGNSINIVDFSNSSLFVWFVGIDNKYYIKDFTQELDGAIVFTIDTTNLKIGYYGLKAFWIQDYKVGDSDQQNNDKRLMSEVRNMVMLVRGTETGTDKTIAVRSASANYGYDGYSAYEMAVVSGKTTLDEDEWLATSAEAAAMYSQLDSKIDDVDDKVDTNTAALQEELDEKLDITTAADTYATKTEMEAVQEDVDKLKGLDGTNFMGIFASLEEAKESYKEQLGWALVGESLSELKAYRLESKTSAILIDDNVYDFTDFATLKEQVATINTQLPLFAKKEDTVYLTQDAYDELVDKGEVKEDVEYNILDE